MKSDGAYVGDERVRQRRRCRCVDSGRAGGGCGGELGSDTRRALREEVRLPPFRTLAATASAGVDTIRV